LRPAFDALFAIDDAMADVVAQSTQPALGAIKLAWWRERLEELDQGKVPAEPRLESAAEELLPRGISGAGLATLEDGWATLLDEAPDSERIARRGSMLFGLAAKLLGSEATEEITAAGRVFATADVARRGLTVEFPKADLAGIIVDRPLRCLTAMSALAARDILRDSFEAEATPGRAWTLLRHRLTGTFPH